MIIAPQPMPSDAVIDARIEMHGSLGRAFVLAAQAPCPTFVLCDKRGFVQEYVQAGPKKRLMGLAEWNGGIG